MDYDRTADAPSTGERGADAERVVALDEDEAAPLSGLEYLENEKPPHYGGE